MTLGLSKDIQYHVRPYFFYALQLTTGRSDIRPQAKWAVSLVSAEGQFIILRGLCGYVWLNILTIAPEGRIH